MQKQSLVIDGSGFLVVIAAALAVQPELLRWL